MNASLTFLGLTLRAGKLEIGEESCGIAARAKKARVILTASDASQNSRTRAGNYCQDSKAPHVQLPFTKDELGAVVGRGQPGMLAITDIGMAAAFLDKLALEYPDSYSEQVSVLKAASERYARRLKEAQAHKKNIRLGKKRK